MIFYSVSFFSRKLNIPESDKNKNLVKEVFLPEISSISLI